MMYYILDELTAAVSLKEMVTEIFFSIFEAFIYHSILCGQENVNNL